MGDLALALIALAITSALLGKGLAQKRGCNPTIGMLVGGVLPFIGLGVIMAMKRNPKGDHEHGR